MAYASVASLLGTIELLLTSDSPISDHREEFLNLHEKVSSLEAFLKNFEKHLDDSMEMKDLEAHIKVIANAAEDKIELGLMETMMEEDDMQKGQAHDILCETLQKIAEDIDRVQRESRKVLDEGNQGSKRSLDQGSGSTKHTLNVQNNMVGRENERERMLAELTRGSSGELKVIPIVGMGGIGKTTLANEVFNDPSVQSHFDVRAWATASKQHHVKEILQSLLSFMIKIDEEKDEAELADLLKKRLSRKRYLVVVDDIWSHEAWDDIKLCFPECNSRSRILVTTRDAEVASYAGSEDLSWPMHFMGPDESWDLFQSKAFANERYPPELEAIGEEIAHKCQGLPLTIVVVAGLLSKSKTIEEWENVAEDVKSFVTKDPEEQCLRVLALSYKGLPGNLKACLLYLGLFPEDSEISVKRLMRLWIAEGFLKLRRDLEGEAEKCLKDLFDRCLVLVGKKSLDGRTIRTCNVHDLIRVMCLKEAHRQNFYVMNVHACDSRDKNYHELDHIPPECRRWISIHKKLHKQIFQINPSVGSLKRTRTIFLFAPTTVVFSLKVDQFNFLRILDLRRMHLLKFPVEILSLIWLRYLYLSSYSVNVPHGIGKLWNLQTFIVRWANLLLPKQIWKSSQLRHLKADRILLRDPPRSVDGERCSGFPNLQTVSGMLPQCCTKEVISRCENIKKLRFNGTTQDYKICEKCRSFDNLVHLQLLETLSFEYQYQRPIKKILPVQIPSAKAFPRQLKELKLVRTGQRWDYLNTLSELPNLEVLKLKSDACCGEEWITEGVFSRLKILLIRRTNLKYWKATSDNLPTLERLVIRACSDLEEIPIEFAEIDSLQLIHLQYCNASLVASAAQIQEEQENIGNTPVDVLSYNNPDADDDDDDDEDDDDDDDDEDDKRR